jgi:hypothetical protein
MAYQKLVDVLGVLAQYDEDVLRSAQRGDLNAFTVIRLQLFVVRALAGIRPLEPGELRMALRYLSGPIRQLAIVPQAWLQELEQAVAEEFPP